MDSAAGHASSAAGAGGQDGGHDAQLDSIFLGAPAGGSPLDSGLRSRLESSLGGESLGNVRVHTDGAAAEAAGSLNAQAFTVGQHIHFGAGHYDSSSEEGQKLIAHEVAHTVQQRGAEPDFQARFEVSSPGDALETEADRFADSFTAGMPAQVTQPVQPGTVSRKLIQRQEPISPQEPTIEELAAPLRQRLIEARAEGGVEGVVAEVRSLRAQATGRAAQALNLAVSQTLTSEELEALGADAVADETAEDSSEHVDETGDGDGDGDEVSENDNDQDSSEDTNNPEQDAEQDGGADSGGTQDTEEPTLTTEQALEPVPRPPADERSFITSELAFHESWSAMRGSTADRAARLFSLDDLVQGGKGAATQVAATQFIGQLAKRVPVPGLGNIIGGGLSAYALFSNGGAGIRALGSSIAEGFSWEGKGPWQIAADVVGAIRGILDLIGNICNILSGLAYAFAAIAAVGGLLSVFFPPLAFLVPYIPTAINFGRACGGVASVCMGISSLLSPIPPILRAIHILVSDQDPLLLAQQEQQYHSEVQGAIASYGSAAVNQGIDTRGGSFNPVSNMAGGVTAGARATGGAARDMRAGNAEVRRTFGFEGQGADGMRQAGANNGSRYFDAGGQRRQQLATEADKEQDLLDGRKGKAHDHRQRADEAAARAQERSTRPTRRAAKLANDKAKKHEARVANSEQRLATAKERQAILHGYQGGSPAGELGTTADNARLAWGADQAPEAQEATVERDERGHVVLPGPPGSLEDVDALDQRIESLQGQLRTQQHITVQAGQVQEDASQRSEQLMCVDEAVNEHSEQHSSIESEHSAVEAQNADISSRTEEQHSSTGGGLDEAASVLGPIAGPARTVNSIVQQVPSNRFFDVSGTQRNLSEFVQGLDQITGQGPEAEAQREQSQQIVDQREQQTQEAQETRNEVVSDTQTLQQTVQTDQSEATSVAQEAQQQHDTSQQEEQTLEQQIQQATQQRQATWGTLVSWAHQHYSIRQAALQR